MYCVSRNLRILLVVGSCFLATALFAKFELEDCSGVRLNQTCQHENAQYQVNCLSTRINKINECYARVKSYEKELQNLITKKVEEKGLMLVNPLRKEKANHLEKMKEFESIMKWHDENLKASSKEYVLFVKEIQESYKKSEARLQGKLQEFSRSIRGVKNYLDLINIRFDVQTTLRDETSRANGFIAKSARLTRELQAIELFIKSKLAEHSEYFDKNEMSSMVPAFGKEIDFARGVAKYAQERMAKVTGVTKKITQRIDLRLIELEKSKLQRDKEINFKDARYIERESSFLGQVNSLVDNALMRVDLSGFSEYEFLGARYKGIEQLLGLDSVCSIENTSKASNDWLQWGCEKYGQIREFAKRRVSAEFPSAIRAALTNIEMEKPGFQVNRRNTVLENLRIGKIEQAIEVYDQLLWDYSEKRSQ